MAQKVDWLGMLPLADRGVKGLKKEGVDMAGNGKDNKNLISQAEIDELLAIHELIDESRTESKSLIDEIQDAILDSAKLTIDQWKSLRKRIQEIEVLVPHIDMIIKLKVAQERREKILSSEV